MIILNINIVPNTEHNYNKQSVPQTKVHKIQTMPNKKNTNPRPLQLFNITHRFQYPIVRVQETKQENDSVDMRFKHHLT